MKPVAAAPEAVQPSWDAAVLVCSACRKRSKAPKGLKTKELLRVMRRAVQAERPRPRLLVTGCLGLCPKGAIAVARVGRAAPACMVAVRSLDHAEAAVGVLTDRTQASADVRA